MSRFTAHEPGLQAIMNYPNVRGLLARTPVKSRQPDARHQRTESFEFRTELDKYAQELKEPQSNVDDGKGPKRARESPEAEDELTVAPPPKKHKAESEADDATIVERDSDPVWDAMLWGSSLPGIEESFSPSSQSAEGSLPEIGDSIINAPVTIPESWNFVIWEDKDADKDGENDDPSAAAGAATWVPEHDDENKENEPPEFDVATGEASNVFESEEYDFPVWSRGFPRTILGELPLN